MATLAHVELTKIQKLLQRKIKNKNENENQNENENENSFLFSFLCSFSFSLLCLFYFFSFLFLNFTMAPLDHYTFVHFKKREKHPWKSVTFSKVAG